MEQAPVDLAHVIGAAVEIAEPLRAGQRVGVSADSPGPGPTVVGDAARLQQVMLESVDERHQFTPTGGAVRVQVCRAGPTAEIQVSDTGQGIPRNALPFVFK